MRKSGCKLLILICIIFLFTGCSKTLSESDLIIPVDKNNIIKTSEADVAAYFKKNKDSLKAVSEYMLNNERVFGTRPVVLNNASSTSEIRDNKIKKLADTLLQEGMFSQISSLNDNVKSVNCIVRDEYGIYVQGIRYVSDNSAVESDKTAYNYVKEYKDLGDGWFYYIFYYNRIKDEEIFRKKAWDMLSERDQKSVRYEWNKAIVTLKDWESVTHKTGKTKYPFVVSVCFNTDVDGLLGPIILHFDPSTREVIGGEKRY